MKAICPISGIKYTVTSPIRGMTVAPHPMLAGNIPVVNLIAWFMDDWAKGDLPKEQSHLFGLALLQKLPVHSIAFAPLEESNLVTLERVWLANIEKLAKVAVKLEGRNREFRRLSRFVVSADTIGNLGDWIADLSTELSITSAPISEKAKELNRGAYKAIVDSSSASVAKLLEPEQVEALIVRALADSPLSSSEVKSLPVVMADWAAKVTEFPNNVASRWKRILEIVFHGDYINQILMSDVNLVQIKAMEEHILLNTPTAAVGTSHSRLLMARIAEVIPVIEDFNPTIVSKRKGSGDNLIDALMGGDGTCGVGVGNGAKETSPTKSSVNSSEISPNKPMTLAERLALRLANAKKGPVSAEDL